MKINKLFLLFAAVPFALVGCNNSTQNKTPITYGTEAISESLNMTYTDVANKIADGENMLLCIYPGENSGCGCWTVFLDVLNQTVKNEHLMIYRVSVYEIDDENKYNLPKATDSPSFVIVENKQLVKTITYTTKDTDPIFKSAVKFKEMLNQNIIYPSMVYVPYDKVEDYKTANGNSIFYFMRGTCGDCKYCAPNVLYPMLAKQKEFKTKLYLVDIDPVRSQETEVYQAYKDNNYLSEKNNKDYGYSTGVVPTFQCYKNKVLEDACVYFNDGALTKVDENTYKVDETYYTEERVAKLKFLADTVDVTKVLKNITVSASDVTVYGEYGAYWNSAAAAKYHNPILEAFLTYYCF